MKKDFNDFKKVFDNIALHDYAVEMADKNVEIHGALLFVAAR
jgi:hypothetical protein